CPGMVGSLPNRIIGTHIGDCIKSLGELGLPSIAMVPPLGLGMSHLGVLSRDVLPSRAHLNPLDSLTRRFSVLAPIAAPSRMMRSLGLWEERLPSYPVRRIPKKSDGKYPRQATLLQINERVIKLEEELRHFVVLEEKRQVQ